MIVYQDRNDEGRRVTAEFYSAFCTSSEQPNAIDRVSFLYGMQAFCCEQLRTEMKMAVDALEGEAEYATRPPHYRRAHQARTRTTAHSPQGGVADV